MAISLRSTLGAERKAGALVDTEPEDWEDTDDCLEAGELLLRYRSGFGRGRESVRDSSVKSTGLTSPCNPGDGSGEDLGVSCRNLFGLQVGDVTGASRSHVPGIISGLSLVVNMIYVEERTMSWSLT